MPENKNKDLLFVSIQFILFFGFIFIDDLAFYTFPITQTIRAITLVLTVSGFVLALIAIFQLRNFLSVFPTPKKDSILRTGGAYAFSRNPIYSGLIVSFVSFSIASASIAKLLFSFLIIILFVFKSRYEESLLESKFKEEYTKYKQKTKSLFPLIY